MNNQHQDKLLFPEHGPGPAPEIRIGGTLKADDRGCIRVFPNTNHRGWTVLWPPDYSLKNNGKGARFVIADTSGAVVGHEGDNIILSGGLIGDSLEEGSLVNIEEAEVEKRCPGGFVYAGHVM